MKIISTASFDNNYLFKHRKDYPELPQIGDVIDGVVSNEKEYGFFVTIAQLEGSWCRGVANLNALLPKSKLVHKSKFSLKNQQLNDLKLLRGVKVEIIDFTEKGFLVKEICQDEIDIDYIKKTKHKIINSIYNIDRKMSEIDINYKNKKISVSYLKDVKTNKELIEIYKNNNDYSYIIFKQKLYYKIHYGKFQSRAKHLNIQYLFVELSEYSYLKMEYIQDNHYIFTEFTSLLEYDKYSKFNIDNSLWLSEEYIDFTNREKLEQETKYEIIKLAQIEKEKEHAKMLEHLLTTKPERKLYMYKSRTSRYRDVIDENNKIYIYVEIYLHEKQHYFRINNEWFSNYDGCHRIRLIDDYNINMTCYGKDCYGYLFTVPEKEIYSGYIG